MTYKEKYIKMFIRFIKELNLTYQINDETINGKFGLLKIISVSTPINIALKFFAIHCGYFSHKDDISTWEDMSLTEFKKDLLTYINKAYDTPVNVTVILKEILSKNNTDDLNFISTVQYIIDTGLLSLNEFYNAKI